MYKEVNSEEWRQETFWLHNNDVDGMRALKMAIEFVQVLESKGGAWLKFCIMIIQLRFLSKNYKKQSNNFQQE